MLAQQVFVAAGVGKTREEQKAAAVVTALKLVFLLNVLKRVWCLLWCK